MRICTIGGTRFSGRAFTGMALEEGHEVTVFHRGGGEEVWPDDRRLIAWRYDGPGGSPRHPAAAKRAHVS